MSRIACGVVAGPFYLVVGYAQAFTREGFDLSRHPFSMLSLGSLGWIQIANFIVSGALFVIARRLGGWLAVVSGLTGVLLMVPMAFLGNPSGTVLLYVVATVGWIW